MENTFLDCFLSARHTKYYYYCGLWKAEKDLKTMQNIWWSYFHGKCVFNIFSLVFKETFYSIIRNISCENRNFDYSFKKRTENQKNIKIMLETSGQLPIEISTFFNILRCVKVCVRTDFAKDFKHFFVISIVFLLFCQRIAKISTFTSKTSIKYFFFTLARKIRSNT